MLILQQLSSPAKFPIGVADFRVKTVLVVYGTFRDVYGPHPGYPGGGLISILDAGLAGFCSRCSGESCSSGAPLVGKHSCRRGCVVFFLANLRFYRPEKKGKTGGVRRCVVPRRQAIAKGATLTKASRRSGSRFSGSIGFFYDSADRDSGPGPANLFWYGVSGSCTCQGRALPGPDSQGRVDGSRTNRITSDGSRRRPSWLAGLGKTSETATLHAKGAAPGPPLQENQFGGLSGPASCAAFFVRGPAVRPKQARWPLIASHGTRHRHLIRGRQTAPPRPGQRHAANAQAMDGRMRLAAAPRSGPPGPGPPGQFRDRDPGTPSVIGSGQRAGRPPSCFAQFKERRVGPRARGPPPRSAVEPARASSNPPRKLPPRTSAGGHRLGITGPLPARHAARRTHGPGDPATRPSPVHASDDQPASPI